MASIFKEIPGFKDFKCRLFEGKIFIGKWKGKYPVGAELKIEPIIDKDFMEYPEGIDTEVDLFYQSDDSKRGLIPQGIFKRIR